MNYLFYKARSNDNNRISSFESNIIDLRKIFFNNHEAERELPSSLQKSLVLMRKVLGLKELPFILLDEDMIRKLNLPQGWESMIFVIPQDVDYIYEFSISDLSTEGIEMTKDAQKREADFDGLIDGSYPRLINMNKERLEFFHLSKLIDKKDNRVGKRYFLFMRNWARKVSAVFRKYKPRLYELETNMIDNEVKNFTYKPIQMSNSNKPVAVIIHGFMSFTEENFTALKKALVQSDEYSKIYGYSYPPNKVGIRDNGLELLKVLSDTGLLYSDRKIDLYAHSEGGLVCRSMIARDLKHVPSSRVNIRHLITAGTPHLGTPVAECGLSLFSIPQIAIYISNTFIEAFFYGASLQSINILKKLALHNYLSKTNNIGLKDMIPDSEFLMDLGERCKIDEFNISGSVVLASYQWSDYSNCSMPIRKLLAAMHIIFNNEKHDGVVPKLSSEYKFTELRPMVLVDETEGSHSEYYGNFKKAKKIVDTVVSLGKVPATI